MIGHSCIVREGILNSAIKDCDDLIFALYVTFTSSSSRVGGRAHVQLKDQRAKTDIIKL